MCCSINQLYYEKLNLDYEASYKKLLTTELFKLLQDKETELGKEALFDYINE